MNPLEAYQGFMCMLEMFVRRPLAAAAIFVATLLVCVGVSVFEQRPPAPKERPAVEKREPERRIVTIVKWLWEKR